jgi:hypothetical protein
LAGRLLEFPGCVAARLETDREKGGKQNEYQHSRERPGKVDLLHDVGVHARRPQLVIRPSLASEELFQQKKQHNARPTF